MKKKFNLSAAVGSVMIIMIASRVLSLLSVQIYMSFFGASDVYLNVYSYAISIPNIIFTSVGTALSTVVIPIYVGHLSSGENETAKKFADNIITVALIITCVPVFVGLIISPILPKFTSFAESDEAYRFAVKALAAVMPVMFFYALNYIFQGMLQAMGHYKLPAFVSVPSSLIVIIYVFTLGDTFGVAGLLVATILGLISQALILIPPLYRSGYRFKPNFSFKSPDIIKAGKMTVPVLFGVGAYQLNMLYNVTMIARFDGMVTLLNYVQNITLYLVLAIVYSVTAVIYPKLTEKAATGDMDGYKTTLSDVLSSVTALLVPMTFGFIAVRKDLLSLIAAWGKITSDDIDRASALLFMYAIGIIGIGLKEILDRALYAVGDTKTSAFAGVLIMAVNVTGSLILINIIDAYGIPLAYSIASLSGTAMLLFALKKRVGKYAPGLLTTFIKCIISSAVMFFAVVTVRNLLGNDGDSVMLRLIRLFVPVAVGVLVYAASALVLKVKPVWDILSSVKNKLGKTN